MEVPPYDDSAAAHYGGIRANLERKGAHIGINDLHIAGNARSMGFILTADNTGKFKQVLVPVVPAQNRLLLSRSCMILSDFAQFLSLLFH